MRTNLFKNLVVLVALAIGSNVFATVYTFTAGSWSPMAPPSPVTTGDEIIISSGTFNQTGYLKINNGASVTIAAGAVWRLNSTDSLINQSSNFVVQGTLRLTQNSFLRNGANGNIVVNGSFVAINDAIIRNVAGGHIQIQNGSVFSLTDNVVLTNPGTISVFSTLNIKTTALVNNTGTIVGSGKIKKASSTSLTNTSGYVNGCTGATCVPNVGNNNLGTPLGAPATMTAYFYPGGSPPPVSCNSFYVIESNLTLTTDINVGVIVVNPGITVTIPSGKSMSVCYSIISNGSVIVEGGGSLVQTSVSNNNKIFNGNFVVKQTGYSSTSAYNIWSSPIQMADLVTTFPSSNPCDMFVINGSTQEWKYDFPILLPIYTCNGNPNVEFTASDVYSDGTPDGKMDIGRGYFIPGNGSGAAKEFTGIANNGSFSINIYTSATPAPGFSQASLNLVGNPYPGGLDASLLWAGNTSLTDGLYFYDNAAGDYAYWNTSGGVPASGGATPSGIIGLGQGFFVVASSNSTMNFENSMRSVTNTQFFKTENTDNHNVWLNFTTPSGQNANILVGYSSDATDDFDGRMDAHLMTANEVVKFSSVINGEDFAIQSVASLKPGDAKKVTLKVFTTEQGTHIFSEFNRENIPSGVTVFILDQENGIYHDLSKGNLSVTLNANQEYANRFVLVFVQSVNAGSEDLVNGSESVTSVKELKQSNFLLLTSGEGYSLYNSDGINGTIRVMDVTGKVVYTQSNISNTPTVRLDLNGFSGGVYIVEIIENGSRVYTTKLVK